MLASGNQPLKPKEASSKKQAAFAEKIKKWLTILGILSPEKHNAPDSRLPEIRDELKAIESYEKLFQNLENELRHAYDAFHQIAEPSFETISNIQGGLLRFVNSDYVNTFESHFVQLEKHLLSLQNHSHSDFPDSLSKIGTALEEVKKNFLSFLERKTILEKTKLDLTAYDQLVSSQLEKQVNPSVEQANIPEEERKKQDTDFLLTSAEMPAALQEIVFASLRICQALDTAKKHTAIVAGAARVTLADYQEMELLAKLNCFEKAKRDLEIWQAKVIDLGKMAQDLGQRENIAESYQADCIKSHVQAKEHLESDTVEIINNAFDANFSIDVNNLDFIKLDETPMPQTSPAEPETTMTAVPPEKSQKRLHFEDMTTKLDAASEDLRKIRAARQDVDSELKVARLAVTGLESAADAAKEELERLSKLDRIASMRTWIKRGAWAVLISGGIGMALYYDFSGDKNPDGEPSPTVPDSPPPKATPAKKPPEWEKTPVLPAEPLPEKLPELTAELSEFSYRILTPLRISDVGLIIDVVTSSVQEDPQFMKKWKMAKTPWQKETLLQNTYSKVPEVKRAQMDRELMFTISVLMQSSKLSTKFTPELYREIMDAVYDQGWSDANEALREKIVEEVLISNRGEPKKTKEAVIQEFLERLKK